MDEIYGFSKVEYLVTFHSIIFGYVASVFLEGWGYILRRRKSFKLDRYLLFFTYEVFTLMLIHWWNLYDRSSLISQNLFHFLEVLPYSIIFYFIATVAFARIDSSNTNNLSTVYFTHRIKLYASLLLFIVYDFAMTVRLENHIFQIVGMFICVAGIASQNKTLHKALITIGIASVFIIIVRNLLNIDHRFIYGSENYSKVEHLTIFISMIYGYVITVYFVGWSMMLRARIKDLSLIQFLWTLFSFLFLIDIWWGSWSRNSHVATSMLHFLLSISTPFLIFIICVLLFPHKKEAGNYLTVFLSNKKLIFLSFSLLFLSQILLSFFFIEDHQNENYFRLAGIALSIVSMKIDNLNYHRILVSIAFLLLSFNVFNQFL
ncbi:hypothetical protein [Marinoscillum pacificum]|uniref:hypothetical protein n=1 Tax=Marinoscillum pacificum TaxID=392723 RepID=UPI002157CF61|nr:hypothetical protein [Marinoscillum pacificum]